MIENARMVYLRMQMKQKEMQASLWNVRIISGEYKLRTVQKWVDGAWTEISGEEKLQKAVQIMAQHIHDHQDLSNMWLEEANQRQRGDS